ncbi:MAG: plasmid recombination protein [Lachnospiraceae bacterium]|nr:plasmid recombination protein [Lachnospiraceae bacterium]
MAKTISFVKGKGSIAHNNRDFVAANVDRERTGWNVTYVSQPIREAYDECFGEAVREYNEKQTRKDRKKDDYMSDIKNSGNGEKLFYENLVQIGKMSDTGVLDKNGNLSEEAKAAMEVLDEYARTFQERNPNLHVFNSVLHMDEATPHLHIDYIPVAHGYKTGLSTRNSLTKAYQEMGIEHANSRRDNETVHWQIRERAYIEDLCKERGIEITVLGIDRDDYTIPEFKEAMRAVEDKEAEIEILQSQMDETQDLIKSLEEDIDNNVDLIKEQNEYLSDLKEQVHEATSLLDIYQKCNTEIGESSKTLNKEFAKIEKQVEPLKTLLGADTDMVKVPKKIWKKVFAKFKESTTIETVKNSFEKILAKKDKKIEELQKGVDDAEKFKKIVKEYLTFEGRYEDFEDYTKNPIHRKLQYHQKEDQRILTKPKEKEKAVGYDR